MDADIQVDQRSGVTTIYVAPSGLRGKAFSFLAGGLLALLVFGGLTGVIISSQQRRPHNEPDMAGYVTGGIALVGTPGLFLAAAHFALRRTTFIAGPTGIEVRTEGPMRKSTRRWACETVRGFSVGQAVSAGDGKTLNQLVIHLAATDQSFLGGTSRKNWRKSPLR